uniref:Uncharacterized protein n=1 Tax=Panagrolaimus superbus TaxID=310955 RepID=A0A914XWL4_9BILA
MLDVNIDEKESGKAVQIPQDDFTNTQGSSGGNEAFNYDDEDISQLLCNIDDNILFNLDEAESLLAEDQVISETMDYTPDANSADKVVDERPSEAMPSNEHFNDLPTSEEKGISNTGNDKEESVILKDAEIEHLTPPEVVDHCEGIQKSPVIIATIESEASTSLPKTFSVPDAVHGDPKSSTVSDLETPLTFENLMKVSLKNEGNKIRAYTEYMFLEDALNGSKTLQTQQLLKQRDSPYYAFKVGQNLVVNCGKVGETKNYRQAVISNNGEKCQVYDFLKDEWVARLQITANNILLFNMPFGTRRSQLGIKRFPRSDGDTECEVVVYKHVFGEWLKTDGSLDTVYCYYTVLGGKLILLYDIGQEYLFDLLWAPYLYYFTFSTEDNHVFKEVVLESYNLMFDTKNSPTTLFN